MYQRVSSSRRVAAMVNWAAISGPPHGPSASGPDGFGNLGGGRHLGTDGVVLPRFQEAIHQQPDLLAPPVGRGPPLVVARRTLDVERVLGVEGEKGRPALLAAVQRVHQPEPAFRELPPAGFGFPVLRDAGCRGQRPPQGQQQDSGRRSRGNVGPVTHESEHIAAYRLGTPASAGTARRRRAAGRTSSAGMARRPARWPPVLSRCLACPRAMRAGGVRRSAALRAAGAG